MEPLNGWRTAAFAETNAPVHTILGDKTAKLFAALRVETVGDLLRHLPRHYLSGTELTDLATLEEGEHVAVMAKVAKTEVKRNASAATRSPRSSNSRL